jgi:hypothetical protein
MSDISPPKGIFPNMLWYPPKEGMTYPTPTQGASNWFKASKDFHPQAGLETNNETKD